MYGPEEFSEDVWIAVTRLHNENNPACFQAWPAWAGLNRQQQLGFTILLFKFAQELISAGHALVDDQFIIMEATEMADKPPDASVN